MVETRILPSRSLQAHDAPVRLIVFGPNDLMFTGDVEMQCVIWHDGEPAVKLDKKSVSPRHRPHDRLRAAAFSNDGKTLFLACGSRLLAIDTASGRELWSHRATEWWPFMISVAQSMAVDNEGCLVVSFDNGSFERWSPALRRIYRRKDHDAPYWLTLDIEAGKIVGCDAYHICTWNLADGSKQSRIKLEDHAYSFAYSPRSGLAAVRDAGTVAVWNLFGTEAGERLSVPPGPPLIAFSPDGRVFAYQCGPEVRILGLDERSRRAVWNEESRHVSLAFDAEGALWTGHADGSVKCWLI
jgi:WD40 repeat protein